MTRPSAAIGPQVRDVMARLQAAGVRVSPNGANVRFSSPGPLAPELRELIVANKAALITALSVWCPVRAAQLQDEADGLVAELGVSGTDPEIAAAAERFHEAYQAQDMAGVRGAVHAVIDRAKRLAGGP